MDLAGLLHRYYTVHHILSVDDRDLLQARLLLFSAVAEVIGRGLDLLGVTAPDHVHLALSFARYLFKKVEH